MKTHLAEAYHQELDRLLDLDHAITIIAKGKQVLQGKVERSSKVIQDQLARRPDPAFCPTAILTITTP